MISHEHKCIFIHIFKCGGTTIEQSAPFKRHFVEREQLRNEVLVDYLNKYHNYFVFTQTRNPYERVLSGYAHSNRRLRQNPQDDFFARGKLSLDQYLIKLSQLRYKYREQITPHDVIYTIGPSLNLSIFDSMHMYHSQSDFINIHSNRKNYLNTKKPLNKNVNIDFIMKLRHFNANWMELMNKLGINYPIPPIKNDGMHDKEYTIRKENQLTDKQKKLIHSMYEEDFDTIKW